MSKQKNLDSLWKARVAKIMGTTASKLGLRINNTTPPVTIEPALPTRKD